MWFNNIRNRSSKNTPIPLFDEGFLRRLERMNFRTAPYLRGGLSGERRSRNLRPALDFSDHRPYTPGDDLRHVDWNAYSRHEELFVKLGEATQSVNVHILLDTSPSMAWSPNQKVTDLDRNYGNVQSRKWDSARQLAGALGYMGLSGGERLEITPFAQTLAESFGPTQGKKRAIPLLRYLADQVAISTEKSGSQSGLVHSLGNYARRHPHGGLLILISDLLDTAATDTTQEWEELAEGLSYFPAPRWQVLVLHLLSEQEYQPTFDGDYDFRDMETGESLPFHLNQTTLTQYRLRVKTWCTQLQSACAKRAATYARILAESPLEQSIIPYLRQRGAVQ